MGIRWNLRDRLNEIRSPDLAAATERKQAWIARVREQPIAIETAKANEQHYEVGTEVLIGTLGPRMKYSACLYPTGHETLAQAEEAMLATYLNKADLQDGMSVLDLGCGWGSGALYYAEKLPRSRITAFSNSRTQKEYIDAQAKARGLTNLCVVTGDVAVDELAGLPVGPSQRIANSSTDGEHGGGFDRIISIEMFEHMKNYEALLAKCARALRPGGKLFVHMFAHRDTPYDYEDGWMTRTFFTGGTMPSADLLLHFQRDLAVERRWWVSGIHYSRTCEDWLTRMLRNKEAIWPALKATYGGEDQAARWWNRWQVFYLACSELFRYEGGDTWGVVHYLFEKPREGKN